MSVLRLCRGQRGYFTTRETEDRLHNERLYREEKLQLRKSRRRSCRGIKETEDLVRFRDLLLARAARKDNMLSKRIEEDGSYKAKEERSRHRTETKDLLITLL